MSGVTGEACSAWDGFSKAAATKICQGKLDAALPMDIAIGLHSDIESLVRDCLVAATAPRNFRAATASTSLLWGTLLLVPLSKSSW